MLSKVNETVRRVNLVLCTDNRFIHINDVLVIVCPFPLQIRALEVTRCLPKGLYTDSSLESIIAQLLTKVANDDPSEEFKQLKTLKPTDNCEMAKLQENKNRNRFRNVLPCK